MTRTALFSTEVVDLEWEQPGSCWLVRTNRGDEMRARFVVMGNGPRHRPELPGIPVAQEAGGELHGAHLGRVGARGPGQTDYTRRAGYDVTGRDGVKLSDYWAGGMRSMFGMHVHGFPNLLVLGHVQGGFTANYPHLLDEASTQMAHVVGHALAEGVREVEVTSEAEQRWLDTLEANVRDVRSFQEQCTPGYYNNEGQPGRGGFILSAYGKGPMPFFALLRDWRHAGDFAGLELRR